MSAPLCTVCHGTGSKSQDLDGDLDCYECSASDERIKFRSAMRMLGNKNGGGTSIDGMNWRAYQLGKAAAAPVVPVAAQPVVQQERAGMLKAADIIGEKANDYLNEFSTTEHDTGAVVFLYGQDGCDYYNSLVELAEEIRSAAPQPAASVTDVAKDAALKALIQVRHALQFANDTPGGPIQDTIWMMDQPETVFDFIDAAIAAQQGEKT